MQVFSLLTQKEKGTKSRQVVDNSTISVFIKKNPSGKETSQIVFGNKVQDILRANNPVCFETKSGKKPFVAFAFYQKSIIISTFNKETLLASEFYQNFLETSGVLNNTSLTEEEIIGEFLEKLQSMSKNFYVTTLNNNGTINNTVAYEILELFNVNHQTMTEPFVIDVVTDIDSMLNPFNGEYLKEEGVNSVLVGETAYYHSQPTSDEEVVIHSIDLENPQEPDWDSIAKQEVSRQLDSDLAF